jgi:hypothetical protein
MTETPPHPALFYKPRGAALALFRDESPELLASGPAGTGKSRACLEKLYWAADKYPGMRALIVRQVRASLTTTGLVTWESLVVPPGSAWLGECSREHRLEYTFPNGSVVTTGGLDKPAKIMSSEYDLIYVQEATELKEEGWEALTTRLRNGVLPYQQLLADCNPSAPTHWLKKRCEAGKCRMLESRHEDNPRLWDGRGWTPGGRRYLAALDNLTGARKLRLRFGRWVQAEGVVYDGWDSAVHVVDPFPVPPEWPRYWAVDFGYTNPFVCQWWAMDPDGRLYLYREIYRTKRLVEDHARHALRLSGDEPKPAGVYGDHDAEDRATFVRHAGLGVTAAVKAVSPGIQLVTERLQKAGDGKPRLFLFRGATVERDPELVEAKRPTSTEEEFDSYSWAKAADGKPNKEEPVKEFDHGLDALRYLVASLSRPAGGISFNGRKI